jgi:hypothetical protein
VRRLYAREATPSMLADCTERLHLSEAEACLGVRVPSEEATPYGAVGSRGPRPRETQRPPASKWIKDGTWSAPAPGESAPLAPGVTPPAAGRSRPRRRPPPTRCGG